MIVRDPPDSPVRQPDPGMFCSQLNKLQNMFDSFLNYSTSPLPSPRLSVTAEIRCQCELYLPIRTVRSSFYKLYRAAVNHQPLYATSPFHRALSWADLYCAFPDWLQISPNPAIILEALLNDLQLLERFIFHSFVPERFNGSGLGRYIDQYSYIFEQLTFRLNSGQLKILDAACGSGEGTWELVKLAADTGCRPEQLSIQGWTIDPLEIYAAYHRYLPHLPARESQYRSYVQPLMEAGWQQSVSFCAVDLLAELPRENCEQQFDIIVCNGLIGGPVVSSPAQSRKIIATLGRLITPDGLLLIDNCFHDGWKKRYTPEMLMQEIRMAGLKPGRVFNGVTAARSE